MGVFTRFKDIVSSNINAMLDKAEEPEKMIKLMIREMEETLVELKAACAGTMADTARIGRDLDQVRDKAELWDNRASLAVDKGREDLAREALVEKAVWMRRVESLDEEKQRMQALVDQCKDDIVRLEEKLESANEKRRLLVQRHIRANTKMRAEQDLRKATGYDAMLRFDEFEQRIERMEAEAGLVNPGGDRPTNLEQEFALLEDGLDLDEALEDLKKKRSPKTPKAKES